MIVLPVRLLGLLTFALAASTFAPGSATAQGCEGVMSMVAGERRCLRIGEVFKDCPDCPEMVVVPAGRFSMGSDANSDEEPVHAVTLRRPYALGRLEVTFADWDACVADGTCKHVPADSGWGRGTQPVIDVSWEDVGNTFLPWLSRKAGRSYRLPSEAEWEYAVRAGGTAAYAWGDSIGGGLANCDGCGSQWDNKRPAPVGSFPPNAFGINDMHGNVWEWTQDCYVKGYAGAPVDGSPRTSGGCENRAVRGGGWNDKPRYLRASSRYGDPATYRGTYIGFRVARTL